MDNNDSQKVYSEEHAKGGTSGLIVSALRSPGILNKLERSQGAHKTTTEMIGNKDMKKTERTRPVWLEINLDRLTSNFTELKKIVDEKAKFMAIVKGNAYGHGAVAICMEFNNMGVDMLGVAMISEAVELRKNEVKGPILVLGHTQQDLLKLVLDYDITQTVYNFEDAKALSDLARERSKMVTVHLKVDSGMNRIGFLPNEASIDEIEKISRLPNLDLEGIFTHFASADEADKTYTRDQFNNYEWVVKNLEERNIRFPLRHVSNGPAMLDLPEYNLDMVRCGVMLYGYFDSDEVDQDRVEISKVMALKAKISNIKTVPANTGISYGIEFTTSRPSVIATLPLGYADGYPRALYKNGGHVLVNGNKAPIVGRICMDQMMIDVTDAGEVNAGDEVTLFGADHDNCMQIEDIAPLAGTIHAEVISNMNRRIPRIYLKNNEVVGMRDYLLD